MLDRIERLPSRDLRRLKKYINDQPYKREGRKPTRREKTELTEYIDRFIKDCDCHDEETSARNAAINAAEFEWGQHQARLSDKD